VTCKELRDHLTAAHGHHTVGWTWDDLVKAHGQFHAATTTGIGHTHDPDVDPGPGDTTRSAP
jgi:predicted phosphodiesterase